MAEESAYSRVEQLPPQYLADFYAGVPGSNVPGIMPLLNQELVNRMMTFGVEGANPFTYTGERIADFTPAEQEAFRLTAEGMGSYLPYFQQAEALTQEGVGTSRAGLATLENRLNQAVSAGEMSTDEALGILRQAPGVGQAATAQGMQRLDQAGGTLGSAQDLVGQAGLDLSESKGITRGGLGTLSQSAMTGAGATGQFDPSGIDSFYNPFEEQVVQRTLDDVADRFAMADIAGRAQAVGAGAFGGSRGRIAGEEVAKQAAREATERVGAIRSAGYGDAARRAQAAFESQQARQANQANLLSNLGAQQSAIGSALGRLGLAGSGQELARGQALAGLESAEAGQGLRQAGALGSIAGQQAGLGGQTAAMGQNLAGLLGTTAGGIGSLGGNLANIYGGAGRDALGGATQVGGMTGAAGQQLAGLGQGVSGLMGTDIARLANVGQQQRGMDQRGLDLAYQNFVGQYNMPLQTIGQIGGIAAGFSPALGGTTLQQQQTGNTANPLMQAAGAGLTAYGALT